MMEYQNWYILLINSSLLLHLKADFSELPISQTVTYGEQAQFRCRHKLSNMISWIVNGTPSGQLPPDITRSSDIENGLTVHKLTIPAIAKHNGTEVVCVAFILSQYIFEETDPVILTVIPGPLPSVSSLVKNASIISWVASFDPDIVYCLEVYNITCGRSLLISECDVLETSYTNDALLPGYIYEYTVTPRSNVEGASNGTSLAVIEEFYVLKVSSEGRKFTLLDDAGNKPDTIMVTIHLDIQDAQSLKVQVLANSYAISLKPLDGENNGMELMPNIDSMNQSSVVLQLSLLYRRLWNYTILAHSCDEQSVTESTILSTHDVQDVFITSPLPDKIRVTGYFINGSTATGVMIAIPSKFGINFYSLSRDRQQLEFDNTISNVEGGQHSVSTFVMDDDGLPVNRAAAMPQTVTVEKGGDNQNLFIEYELHPTSTGVCITCTLLDSSPTDCVAVVHQRISLLRSNGLLNIKSSHKFNKSGDSAHGCIEEVNLEQYQIGVVGGVIKQQPTTESTESIVPPSSQETVVVTVLLVLIIAVLMIFIVIFILMKKKGNLTTCTTMYICCSYCRRVHHLMSSHTEVDTSSKALENDPLKVEYSEIDPKSQVTRTKKSSIKQSTPVEQGDVDLRKDDLENKQHAGTFLQRSEGSETEGDVELRKDDLEKKQCDESFPPGSGRSEDYQSDFDQLAVESSESTNQDSGQFESGKDISGGSAPDTGENDSVMREYQSKSSNCASVSYSTGYKGLLVYQGKAVDRTCDGIGATDPYIGQDAAGRVVNSFKSIQEQATAEVQKLFN